MNVLLCGIQKVGSTFIRFVIFNYFNILNHGATKTLTWDELEKPHLLRQEHGLDYVYNDGYPMVFFTHNARDGQGLTIKYDGYPEYFKQFDRLVYIYRNPHDTMISNWHFIMDRDNDSPFGDYIVGEALEKLKSLEGFVDFYLPKYCHHIETTLKHADLILDYDILRKDTTGFKDLMTLIVGDYDESILEKAIEMSSFENIKKMSIEIGEPYGLGGPNYKGFFCRDGRSNQYKEVMSDDLIIKITKRWLKSMNKITKRKIKKYDVMVTTFFVDWTHFSTNIKSWFKELPIRKLYFGCSNPDESYHKPLKEFLSQYKEVEYVDQRGMKTLGMCIADLMKRCTTEWFIYLHNDVFLTRHIFLVMEAEIDDDIGIIESDRVQYTAKTPKLPPNHYPYYYFRERAFSGFQLIRKKAIESILNKIEDDFVYRNEDIIFENTVKNAGYKYLKSFAMHIHTCSKVTQQWTPQGKVLIPRKARAIAFDMQIKGIVKYCTPDLVTIKAWKAAFGVCRQVNQTKLSEFLKFVREINPIWEDAILDNLFP